MGIIKHNEYETVQANPKDWTGWHEKKTIYKVLSLDLFDDDEASKQIQDVSEEPEFKIISINGSRIIYSYTKDVSQENIEDAITKHLVEKFSDAYDCGKHFDETTMKVLSRDEYFSKLIDNYGKTDKFKDFEDSVIQKEFDRVRDSKE